GTVRRLADHLHARPVTVDQLLESPEHAAVIVDQHDADRLDRLQSFPPPQQCSPAGPGFTSIKRWSKVPGMEAEGSRLPPQFLEAESVDARMVALMRSMLAVSALVIFVFDPFRPSHFSTGIYVALLCYGVYSVVLCIAITGGRMPVPPRAHHWVDAAACVLLVALSQDVTDMFFYFFFFAILVASFSRGFREGLTLTAVSVALFVAICLYGARPGAKFDFDDLVTRPVFLLVLGYMTAYWGGKELLMRRRLRLLRELAGAANPRLGIDHARDHGLYRVLELFQAPV